MVGRGAAFMTGFFGVCTFLAILAENLIDSLDLMVVQ